MPTRHVVILWYYQTVMFTNQTNGGFVYVKLNANYMRKVSGNNIGNNMLLLTYFTASLKTNATHLMDLSNWIWLETKLKLSSMSQLSNKSPASAEINWHQPTSITPKSQSNYYINSSYNILCRTMHNSSGSNPVLLWQLWQLYDWVVVIYIV